MRSRIWPNMSWMNSFPIADSPLACQANWRLHLVIRDGIIYDAQQSSGERGGDRGRKKGETGTEEHNMRRLQDVLRTLLT